ncbi:universal stress protein [Rufibacter sediminis]|uniref:Universal stress protein n=1 Tax=Rufibacter sediminis TaxID=2762756 RepID=A0ABR6VW37_9BACT|nr:universal stress protein [Rufibacter sediminis]MBC3541155.1 universal stress protein [Rufibacter sediminis]
METIICPTDFSTCAENALWYSDSLAQWLQARIVLFHNVYVPVVVELAPAEGVPFVEAVQDPEYRQMQQTKLDILIQTFHSQDREMAVPIESRIKYGDTLSSLVKLAKDEHADLIVLGHAGFQEMFDDSFTASIIKESPCPVLIVPPHVTFSRPKKIVFATDLQGESFTDVSLVCQLARLFQAEIQLLHVLKEESFTRRQEAQAGLALLKKRMPHQNLSCHLTVHPELAEGIHRFCFDQQADMLVVGWRNKNLWQQLFQHDKTSDIAAHSFLPLLVIHHQH